MKIFDLIPFADFKLKLNKFYFGLFKFKFKFEIAKIKYR